MLVRIDLKTGQKFTPHRYKDGKFRVSDSRGGNKKHHGKNQLPVRESELVYYWSLGYHVRMSSLARRNPSLIAPQNIQNV